MRISVLWITTLAVLAVGSSPARLDADPCNFESSALADVYGGSGWVETHHFGQVTDFDCQFTPRKFALKAVALLDNETHASNTVVLKESVKLGQSIVHEKRFSTCSGAWTGTTETGYSTYGVKTWTAEDVSGVFYAYCAPPPPPPPKCELPYRETLTWELGTGGTRTADVQTTMGLTRREERPEGSFLMEEWALVAHQGEEPVVSLASSDAFGEEVHLSLPTYAGGVGNPERTVTLVVEAARHAANARQIPLPDLAPLRVPFPATGSGEFWFRAEVGENGVVDRPLILHASNRLALESVRRVLRRHLLLKYKDSRRHRAVVFGVARIDAGRLFVPEALVTLPQCCCGDEFCI